MSSVAAEPHRAAPDPGAESDADGGRAGGFVKALTLTDATMLVAGSMIGSGIFIVSADIARTLRSPALLLAAWGLTGVITLLGALAYGELAAMYPRAGGQYVFLREAMGPAAGFLYGWTLFVVIQTGTIAAVAVAFGRFLGVLVPGVTPRPVRVVPAGRRVRRLARVPRRRDAGHPARPHAAAASWDC
jgi:APA family basic amino acid/polyamine antiporter